MKEILEKAISKKQKALSEYESKLVLAEAGVPVTREKLARTREEAVRFADEIGYPVAMKGCSHLLTHKTESGVIHLNLDSPEEVEGAFEAIEKAAGQIDGVLVQEMVKGNREFVIGLTRDPQFGPCVMFGLGGIFTEVLKDVSFRIAPLTEEDAEEMLEEIRSKELLDEFRGSPAVDRDMLVKALIGIGDLGERYDEIAEIDVNPLIVSGSRIVAVDALVILHQ
ncbi:MAG: acetate--CoA ligase family protein [Spirochaetes bacterium]|nr:acetate--CoA ligase family protein [Spirochaetota bacterium]